MKKIVVLIGVILSVLGLSGCGAASGTSENTHAVYYLSNSETKIEMHEYTLQAQDTTGQVEELLQVLQSMPSNLKYKAPLSMGFQVLDYSLKSEKLLLNVSKEYLDLTNTQEILVRAAIVKTMTQLEDINFVGFTVEGQQLTDSRGNPIGWESQDQFVENEGNEINTYEQVVLTLYFANETGDGLMACTRTKEYNTNISKEKLIVEELIAGPNNENAYPSVNSQTKVASVAVQDGICYVNLDESFLTPVPNVTAEVTMYSIVNSLVELSNINKVQISVNGDSNVVFRDSFSLDKYYERNLDLIVNDQ